MVLLYNNFNLDIIIWWNLIEHNWLKINILWIINIKSQEHDKVRNTIKTKNNKQIDLKKYPAIIFKRNILSVKKLVVFLFSINNQVY